MDVAQVVAASPWRLVRLLCPRWSIDRGWCIGRRNARRFLVPLGRRARRTPERSYRDVLAAKKVTECQVFEIEVNACGQRPKVRPGLVGCRHERARHGIRLSGDRRGW